MHETLRSPETQKAYDEYTEKYSGNGKDHFADWEDRVINEYNHWVIISNLFPYDKVAQLSHLLITKRIIPFEWRKLNKKELAELKKIKKEIRYKYDCLLEDLPSVASIPTHFHLHLLKFK